MLGTDAPEEAGRRQPRRNVGGRRTAVARADEGRQAARRGAERRVAPELRATARQRRRVPATRSADPDDAIAVLQYTGGTTGLPKGAMLTHANLSAACRQYLGDGQRRRRRSCVEGQERVLAVLPLFHIYALTVNMLLGIRWRGRADPAHALRRRGGAEGHRGQEDHESSPACRRCSPRMLNHPEIAKYDLSSLKFCGSGGAPLPVEVAQRFAAVDAAATCSEGWGMTETSPTGTFTPGHGKRKAGSCGLPMPRHRDPHARPRRSDPLRAARRARARCASAGRT